MGCLFSKSEKVRTLSNEEDEPLPASAFSSRGVAHAWLQEIGLPQYAAAFEDAGFSDWDLLSCLSESDLDAISAHTGTVIAPGHRKKLLMASRQMGQSTAGIAALAPLFSSARRYSHTSNPGNGHGSRIGGLAAAASAALDRRSGGRRPSGTTSRVPSHHSHYGSPGHNSHPSHHYLPTHHSANTASRHATEDGMASARPARPRPPNALLLASRNSSRNSLLNGGGGGDGPGHAIGYIASPSGTLGTTGGGSEERAPRSAASGNDDAWSPLDGRPSTAEPPSPHPAAAALAAAAAALAAGTPAPQRQRKRWSVSQQASRGALVNGGGGGGRPVSGSSVGWVEQDALIAVGGRISPQELGGGAAGGSGDGVRQPSGTSVPTDGSVAPARRVTSRELEALVVGASEPQARGNASRAQHALAPARPAGGAAAAAAELLRVVPASPPRFASVGASNGVSADAAHAQAQSRPASRLSTPRSALAAGSGAGLGPGAPPRPRVMTISASNFDGNDPPLSPLYKYPLGSVVATASAGLTPPGAAVGTPSGHNRRANGAADSTLQSWALNGVPPSPPLASRNPSQKARGVAAQPAPSALGGGGGEYSVLAPTSPGAAWALQPDTPNATAVMRPHDDDVPAATALGRGGGGGGGALPRFVRAIAGWAVPGAGGAAAPSAVGAAGGAAAADRCRSGEHQQQQQQQQRRSTLADLRPQPAPQPDALAAAALSPPGGRWPRSAGPGSGAARRGRLEAGGGGGAGLPGGTDHCGSPDASVPRVAGAEATTVAAGGVASSALRGRSSRKILVPDAGSRGPWDQNTALCIQGRGYRPAPVSTDAGGSSHAGSRTDSRVGTGAGDGDAGGVAAAAAAARGGGWPFVMPQLPQPGGRISNSGGASGLSAQPVIPPLTGVTGAAVCGNNAFQPSRLQAQSGGGGGGAAAESLSHIISPSGPAFNAAAAAAAAGASPFSRLSPLLEATSSRGDGRTSNASTLLETLTVGSDATSATTAQRAPPMHSSRPPGWLPSNGDSASEAVGDSAAAVGGGPGGGGVSTDVDMMSDDLAPALSSPPNARPHRVQIVHMEPSAPMPYDVASYGPNGGRGGGRGAGGSVPAAAQWPAMPLQPPTRVKPASPMPPPSAVLAAHAAAGAGGGVLSGAGINRVGMMELLPPEPPWPGRTPQPVPANVAPALADAMLPGSNAVGDGGGSGGGEDGDPAGPPRPTPGRQLDLEMLADQVSRIMTHLTHITGSGGGDEAGNDGGADAALVGPGGDAGIPSGMPTHGRRAPRGLPSSDADEFGDPDAASTAVASPRQPPMSFSGTSGAGGGGGGSRMEAMDRKRQELQELHRDLVTRVAALAAQPSLAPPPVSYHGLPQPADSAGGATSPDRLTAAGGGTAAAAAAAEALAEVEARIRTKLSELAALTEGPDAVSGGSGGGNAGSGGNGADPVRKRSLDVAAGGGGAELHEWRQPPQQHQHLQQHDAGARELERQRQRAEEVALHEEVLAVLGARKRQARAGRRSSGSGSPRVSGSGAGADAGMGPGMMSVAAMAAAAGTGSPLGNAGRRPQSPLAAPQHPSRSPGQPARSRQTSPLRERGVRAPDAARGGGGSGDGAGDDGGGTVLAEMHDALRAELLAIENKIRARVREGSGAAVTRRA